MTIQRVPIGWSEEQLRALNELDEYVSAYTLIVNVISATGDNSIEANRIKADLLNETRGVWNQVKTFTP